MNNQTRTRRRLQLGYSLAEVMVAMAILTIVILAALTIYDRSNRMFNQGVQAGDMQQSTRVAFDRLVSDIRLTGFDYDRDGIPFGAMAPSWLPNTSYVLGNQVQPSPQNGHVYVCIAGGKSNPAPPAWPTGSKDTVPDGGVTWQEQDIVHYQQPDEQIEYAGESAITIRANFDYNTEVGPCAASGAKVPCENGREQDLESIQFPMVTTDNDEIVTYALVSQKASANASSIVFYADIDRPRDVNPATKKKEAKITITGVDLTNNNPPYTLYRYTLKKDTSGSVVPMPIADNIRRLTFHYYTDTAGTAEMMALPYGDGQYDGANPDATIDERDNRAKIKAIRIDLVGMNPNMDAAFNDSADTAAPHYRKYELDSLVVPRNIGKHGLKEFNTLPPNAGLLKTVCSGACNGVYVTWAGPTSGGDVDSYNIVYDVGDCNGAMSCTGCSPGYSIAEDAGTNLEGYATKITPGQTYRFSIQTVNKYGSATATNCIAVNVLNLDKPADPTDLLASGGGGPSGVYPAVSNGVQLYWTPVTTHNSSKNSMSCADGSTKTVTDIVPGENVRYRIWRSKDLNFQVTSPLPAGVTQVLNEGTATQPTVSGTKITWLDTTAPMGSCITYYYRVQAVTVPCCNNDAMNQGNDKTLAVSDYFPPLASTAKDGKADTPATPLAPTGLGTATVTLGCTSPTCVKVSWSKVTSDTNTPAGPMFIDSYTVNEYLKDNSTGAWNKIGTQTTTGGVTSATFTGLDASGGSFYQFTVQAVDCKTSAESTPVPWPCDWTGGDIDIEVPNYGGSGASTNPYIIQFPTTVAVKTQNPVAKVEWVLTEGSTPVPGGSGTLLTNSNFSIPVPQTDDGVVARLHITITSQGANPCQYNRDVYLIDEPPPACALTDSATDPTVFVVNTASNFVDIILKNTSGDVLKPKKLYLTWDNSTTGLAKEMANVGSITFDQNGTTPQTVTTTCSSANIVATPSTPADSIAANQQNYVVRVQFTPKSGANKNLSGNPIKGVCVQYQSPFGDIKTCKVAPNAGDCTIGTGTCF